MKIQGSDKTLKSLKLTFYYSSKEEWHYYLTEDLPLYQWIPGVFSYRDCDAKFGICFILRERTNPT